GDARRRAVPGGSGVSGGRTGVDRPDRRRCAPMSVILIVAALCLAPWRSRAVERLAMVTPPRPRSRNGSAPFGLARPDLRRLGLPGSVLSRVATRSVAPDPGALAQLVDLLAAALTAGLPAPDALA